MGLYKKKFTWLLLDSIILGSGSIYKEVIEDIIKYLCTLIFNAASSIIEKQIGNDETVPQ